MTNCEYCDCETGTPKEKCCYLTALEIKRFKQRVLHTYIIEVIFDMIVSTISVVLDLITLLLYTIKGKWLLALLTAIPVLLPTTVFTNVYMTDETNKKPPKPKESAKKSSKPKLKKDGSRISMLHILEQRVEGSDKLSIFNCLACWSGALHSLFHKDRNIRKRGGKLMRKSIRRTWKYVFGTLILRFIAWSWYLKALVFGVKALRNPRKFMKLEQPEMHWSRELLIRLDFLQAALENAPQCVIQLFTLLTDYKENQTLGLLTLGFSFIDFVRVVTTVFWNVNRGPVVAPEGSYGERLWKGLNITSWVSIYTARCCAIAMIIGSAITYQNWVIAVPIVAAIVHCVLFAKLFSNIKFGQASQKIGVTTFISLFFLPELDSTDVHVMIQLYYALILLENTIFTIPFMGLDFPGYCFERSPKPKNETTTQTEEFHSSHSLLFPFPRVYVDDSMEIERHNANTTPHQDCLIQPWIIVFLVPFLTICGSLIRLTASQKMAVFKKNSRPKRTHSKNTMEERVANIYNKKWTTMSMKEMWTLFTKMLRKEETHRPSTVSSDMLNDIYSIDIKPQDSQTQVKVPKCLNGAGGRRVKTDRMDRDEKKISNSLTIPRRRSSYDSKALFISMELRNSVLGRRKSSGMASDYHRNFDSNYSKDPRASHNQVLEELGVEYLKVETPYGIQIFGMTNI